MKKLFRTHWVCIFFIGCFVITSAGCKQYVTDNELRVKKENLAGKVKKLEGTLGVLNAEIDKNNNNIRKMQDRLKESKRNRTSPDMSKLHQSATAGGQRTAAFYEMPEYLQAIIDDFEKASIANAVDSIILAANMFSGDKATAHYITEISRSHQFIEKIKDEREKIQQQLDEAKNELADTTKKYEIRFNPDLYGSDNDGCFTGDMFVLMEKGAKHINAIEAGEKVLTADDNGNISPKEVSEHFIYENNHYYLVNNTIKVTGKHRFFTKHGWKRAQTLQIGDEVWTSAKDLQRIDSITRFSEENKVYCLEVIANHNFFISQDKKTGYLVHNCDGGGGK